MATTMARDVRPFYLDRDKLIAVADARRDAYRQARPFPHIAIDDFLPPAVLDGVLAEFPSPHREDWHTFDSPTERKLATKDDSMMGQATRQLLAEFNSAAFIDFLERLTGIEGLVPDPHFVGGGLHQIERGGHLKVHADFNVHPHTRLQRRLNVLVYLNKDWQDEYGGALELWDKDMSKCEQKIMPLFNRCVVFSTTDTSYHGHPEPLACPEGMTRKSIALYYYTAPAEATLAEHNTLFQARPGEDVAPSEPDHSQVRRRPAKEAARMLTPPILLPLARKLRRRTN